MNKKILPLISVFLLSLFIHIIGLNQIGRTWDEQFKVDFGYLAWDRLLAGDFSVESWNFGTEHPMVAKYIYGATLIPHLIRVDNIQTITQLSTADYITLTQKNNIITGIGGKIFAVSYDLTIPHLLSAIFNSFTVLFTFLIARKFFKTPIALLSALFLTLTPRFVVMGQLITYESLSAFLLSGMAWFYLSKKDSPTTFFYIILGVFSGLLFWTRYSNYYVFLFLAGLFLYDFFQKKKRNMLSWKLILVPLTAFFLGILIWPLTWHDFPHFILESFRQNSTRPIHPSFYYPFQLLVTTPIPILLGLMVGVFYSVKKRGEGHLFLLWWFFSALLVMSITSVAMGGTRYIFLIYPSLGILSGYGYWYFFKNKRLTPFLSLIVLFLVFELFRFSPYYLDYYNQFVGGPRGAASHNLEISWWGEGQREVGMWLNDNAHPNSSIGLLVTPQYVFPNVRSDMKLVDMTTNPSPQYIVMSQKEYQQLFPQYKDDYQLVYSATIDSVPLVVVLEHK